MSANKAEKLFKAATAELAKEQHVKGFEALQRSVNFLSKLFGKRRK